MSTHDTTPFGIWSSQSASMKSHRQFRDPSHKVRKEALGLADHLDLRETFVDLFPDDPQLQFCKPIAHAAVYAKAEGQVMTWIITVYNELVSLVDDSIIPVA